MKLNTQMTRNTSKGCWPSHTTVIVLFLLVSCVLAAAGPDDTPASTESGTQSPATITDEYQKYALSLKPSEVWYVPAQTPFSLVGPAYLRAGV